VAKLRAAVLAAGRGARMGGGTPKTLLPVGGREPLLHYILAGLKRSGVEDLVVVGGHRSGDVQAFVDERWGTTGVTYVFNARYASWGNFHSVRVALDQSPGFDVLVVNSDVIVHPDVYGRVVETPGDLVLAVERRRRLDQEDMRVQLRGTRVADIGKGLKDARSHGEFDGVSLLRLPAARHYLDVATDLEWRGETILYYEDVYARFLDRIDARAAFVEPGEYAEVDVPEDVEAAGAVIDRYRDAWAQPVA
jgi:L-glutamine-phosphate cytidylyltransferase